MMDFHWTGLFATEEVMIEKPFEDWPDAGATLSDQGGHYLIQTAELDVEIEKTPFKPSLTVALSQLTCTKVS